MLLEFELLPEFAEFEEFDEPLALELFELFDVFGVFVVPEPLALAGALLPDKADVLLPAELPVTDVCVEPGSTESTTPAATTEAKDTPTVVALSRRLPCSRSATARAIWRPGV